MKPVARSILPRLALLALPLLLAACATPDPVTGRRTYNIYSMQDDIKLGQSTLQANTQELQRQGVAVDADPFKVAKIREMVRRIAAASDLPDLPYSITLYHTNIVNAAAAPGGSMFVFEGLYDPEIGLVRDDDELAAVIAHEIAHVTCRHVTERLSKLVTAAMVAEIAAAVATHNEEEQWAQIFRGLFAVGTALYIPTYGRKDEYEADRVGLRYLARAGYDPRAAVRIWKRASERKGEPQSTSIFATHPSSRDRWEALEGMMPEAMEEYRKATGRYPAGFEPKPYH